ncbi:20914_t:CDS:2 [Dentiscutata erythropus]|uniref:20914_t:CDS:1 n=1 Tax=Dentiscutata erythropus TaxID=1348616 RepID=A0A9N9JFE4_9GLOM|nr:20914_t:CDS:2 [Dentiscutata erythropus]
MMLPKPVSPQGKCHPKANVAPEALSNCGFVPASLYQAESRASLANAFDDLDVSSQNDSSAVLSEHDQNILENNLQNQFYIHHSARWEIFANKKEDDHYYSDLRAYISVQDYNEQDKW